MKRWDCIAKRFDKNAHLKGAEIGVFRAKMSKQLLILLPNLTLYMIDRWAEYSQTEKDGDPGSTIVSFKKSSWKKLFNRVKLKVAEFKPRAKIMRIDSVSASEKFKDNYLDFVFLDALHCYPGVKADAIAWLPKIKPGGWICGHDYLRTGVKKAVDEIFQDKIEIDDNRTWFVRVK